MSKQLLSSKIVIIEEEPKLSTIPAIPTAVVGCVGVTERGPIGVATLVTSFEEYVDTFGGFTLDSEVAIAAHGFFLNEGQYMWIVRTVHYTDVTLGTHGALQAEETLQTDSVGEAVGETESGNGPWLLADGDTLVIGGDNDGAAWGPATATFNGTAAEDTSGAETFDMEDGWDLTVVIDRGLEQTITFSTGEFVDIDLATAQEVVDVINAQINGAHAETAGGGTTVKIISDTEGSESYVEVTGGTAAAVLGFSGVEQSGGGNVPDVTNVTPADAKTVIDAAIGANATCTAGTGLVLGSVGLGTDSNIQVLPASTADLKMGFDNAIHLGTTGAPVDTLTAKGKTEGDYANSIQIAISDATSGVASEFNLGVLFDGYQVETFPNVTMDSTADNYALTVVNALFVGSNLIVLEDESAPGDALQKRPANDSGAGPLSGGADGIVGISDIDFMGNEAGENGLYALDRVQNLTMLIVPGKATSGIQNAMLSYCEGHRDGMVFCVLDPPSGLTAVQMVSYIEDTAALLESSEFGAIYWPYIQIINPKKALFGDDDNITVAPSGFIAGVYARTDASGPGGVYKPPAGIEEGRIFGCVGFEQLDPTKEPEVLDEKKRDLIYPKRINPITKYPGSPRHIDGSRTLKSSGNFPYVSERRGVIFIEASLKIGLLFAKHKRNNRALRQRVHRTTYAFLKDQMDVDAFSTRNPKTAFFVDTSDQINPPSMQFAGRLIQRIGLATAKPAEFLILRVSQDTRAFEEELAA